MPPLSSLDSAFQLQEYISLLIRRDVHDVNTIVSVPDSGSKAGGGEVKEEGGSGEEGRKDGAVDESCWMYEQLRCVLCFVLSYDPLKQVLTLVLLLDDLRRTSRTR